MVSALNIDDHLEHIEGLQQLAAGSRKQLGELLQDSGRLTSAKLDEVLSEQQRTGQRIGEIITQHKLLSDTELGVALEFQGRQSKQGTTVDKLKLGNVLIASGKITPDQLSEALALQAKEGGRLGDVLVALGYISKLEINTGLDLQSKLLGAVLSLSMMTAASSFVAGNAQASVIKPWLMTLPRPPPPNDLVLVLRLASSMCKVEATSAPTSTLAPIPNRMPFGLIR